MILSRIFFLLVLIVLIIVSSLWFTPVTEKYSNFFQDNIPIIDSSPAPVDSSKYEISSEVSEQAAIMRAILDTAVRKDDLSQHITSQHLDARSIKGDNMNISGQHKVSGDATFKSGVIAQKPITISMANGNLVQLQTPAFTGGINMQDGHMKLYSNGTEKLQPSLLDAPRVTFAGHNIVGSSKDLRFARIDDVNQLSPWTTHNTKVQDDLVVVGDVVVGGPTAINKVLSAGGASFHKDNVTASKVCVDDTCLDKEQWAVLATKPIGPIGPPGNKGMTGEGGGGGGQGPKGNTGSIGAQGVQGEPGPKGTPGPAGAQGNEGRTGPDGITGPRGANGPIGDTGDKGDAGRNAKNNIVFIGTQEQNNKINLEIRLENGVKYYVPVETIWNRVVNDIRYSNGIIHVWYSDGTLQRITIPLPKPDDTGRYSVTGPPGPEGPQGDPGDAGTQGQRGDRGAHGRSVDKIALVTGNIRITYTDGIVKDIPIEQVLDKYVTGVHKTTDSLLVTYSDGTTNEVAKLENKDCVVQWGPWSSCSVPCGKGNQTRDGMVIAQPHFNGTLCPPLKQTRECQVQPCMTPVR